METKNEIDNKNSHKNKVHKVLAHSYLVYFILFLAGVCLDLIFKFKIYTNPIWTSLGILFLTLGTLLIIWAQRTSRNLKKDIINRETFCRGPYCYTRNPTHWGLLFLILGFGIITNAPFVIFSAFVSFVVAKFIFLKKQEEILALKYGSPYLEYKKLVKF
jgi:protein-S-isoprenylcysteine O-methyltransferase Ste14